MNSNSNPIQNRLQEVYSIVPFVAADGTVYLVFRKDLDNLKKKFNIDDFPEKNGVLFSEKHQLSKEDDDVFIVNVSDGPPPPPPPSQANVVLVQLGQIPNYDNIDSFVANTLQPILHLAVQLLFTIDARRTPLQQEQTPPPPQHQPPSDQDIDDMIQEIIANIKKFLKEFLEEKKGGKKRTSSTIRKSSSSRRGRRSAKKRGTKRKQKRRQRRASRRAY